MSDVNPPEPAEEAQPERASSERTTHPYNELHGDQTGARAAKVHERATEMVQLRKAGVMPKEIAERYGISASRVRGIISHELRQNRARAASELRDLYESRYEDLIRAYVRDALGWVERDASGAEVRRHPPDLKAAEFCLKALGDLRKLQGMDRLTIVEEGASQEERAASVSAQLEAYLQGVVDAAAQEGASADGEGSPAST